MESLLETMRMIQDQKQYQLKSQCDTFIQSIREQLPSLLHPSRLHVDGALYLPIKEGCASFVLEELQKKGVYHSAIASPKNKCIRIALTDDHSRIHAVPLSHSCEYIKRIFNQ